VTAAGTVPGIIRIDELAGEAQPITLDTARLAPGSPMPAQTARNLFTDATRRFFCGIWSGTRGAWRVSYSENELCVLTHGRVRISDAEGRTWTFGPGDCFVVPAGFEGLWEVLEDAQKFYAIYEAPPAADR
jgi:uncharacterized cupin superfamily protein